MGRRTAVMAAVAVSTLVLAGCNDANQKDIKGIPGTQPDSITVYTNIDQHPNFARVCAGGIAFLTTSREYPSIMRLPEWDWTCPKPPGFQPYRGAPTSLPVPFPLPTKQDEAAG
jgi:hypothetical protein